MRGPMSIYPTGSGTLSTSPRDTFTNGNAVEKLEAAESFWTLPFGISNEALSNTKFDWRPELFGNRRQELVTNAELTVNLGVSFQSSWP